MKIILSHPQSAIQKYAISEEDESEQSLLATIKAASRVQAAGSLLDWLGAARIALQVGVRSFCIHALDILTVVLVSSVNLLQSLVQKGAHCVG